LAATAVAVSLAGCAELRSAATGECAGERPLTLVMVDGSATQADGSTRPVAGNASKEDRQRNRRVEVVVRETAAREIQKER